MTVWTPGKLAKTAAQQPAAFSYAGHGLRTKKELVHRIMQWITQDLSRVMTRVKAIYRSWAVHVSTSGESEFTDQSHRAEWLAKINEPGVHRVVILLSATPCAAAALRQQCGGISGGR